MKSRSWLYVISITLLAPWLGVRGDEPSTRPIANISVAPVIRSGSALGSRITICIRNESKGPIRYVPETAMSGMVSLELTLLHGSRALEVKSFPDPFLSADLVRILPPGGTILQSLDLEDWFGHLAPGTYELRAVCGPPVIWLGLTALQFDGTIMYIEVPDRRTETTAPTTRPTEAPIP